MKGAIDWFAKNPVAANLLMVMILAGGFMSLLSTKREVFPEINMDLITIEVPYLGAAPEEVEEGVSVRIEEAIQGIDGIKRITSTSAEGMGQVVVELEIGANASRVVDEVKSRVDAIDTFPEETEKPIIREITNRRQVINVAVSGPADESTLKRLGERVRDEISAIEGITLVELQNARPYEISIEVSRGGPAPPRDDVRPGGARGSIVVARPSRRLRPRPTAAKYSCVPRGRPMSAPSTRTSCSCRGRTARASSSATSLTVVDGFAETDQQARFDGRAARCSSTVFRTVGSERASSSPTPFAPTSTKLSARMPEGISLDHLAGSNRRRSATA